MRVIIIVLLIVIAVLLIPKPDTCWQEQAQYWQQAAQQTAFSDSPQSTYWIALNRDKTCTTK